MARLQKAGLDYFPFSVGLLKDKKLRRPKIKYGYLATEVYIALLSLLYSDKGYYIPYGTQGEKDDCIWYVFDCLQGKYQPKINTIEEVIADLVACGLFSNDLFPVYITSKRAQAVYYSATVERKTIVIDDAVWLLSLDEMKSLSERHAYYLSKAIRPKNREIRPNISVIRSNIPESKVKDRNIDTLMRARETFCERFRVVDDCDDFIDDSDFEKLTRAYEKSEKFLQKCPSAGRYLSWIVRNYAAIVSGKYDDFRESRSFCPRVKIDDSADELNKFFAAINKDF